MKKFYTLIPILCFFILGLTGCQSIGSKSASVTSIYLLTTVLAISLLIAYYFLVDKKNIWFTLLFSSVSIVNIGYLCLAISSTLSKALLANRITYLGSVLLPLSMLFIILHAVDMPYPKWLVYLLFSISVIIFSIAGSPGYSTIYYKEVSLITVNGASVLKKVYGPLHSIYFYYLIGYFASMVYVILLSIKKKKVKSVAHAILLAGAVFVNIGVWLIEQMVSIDFEILSISYIITGLFLLGIHFLQPEPALEPEVSAVVSSTDIPVPEDDRMNLFIEGLKTLTPKEKELYACYISAKTTKVIMEELQIKENTLKFHSKNLYSKLNVKSRKQLIEMYQLISSK